MSAAPMAPDYLIRECESFEDFSACLEMQRRVWQFSDLDITPLRSFVITRRSGGFTLGSFDPAGRLLGFAHALAAFDERRRPYYYSHMLAVEREWQNSGIGVRLKLAQRDRALERGVPLLTWTFDPLQSRNAYLNLARLGGVVRTYYANYYGNASTSALHRGLDTDRLFVEWWAGSGHVAETLAGRRRRGEPAAEVEIPREIEQIKAEDMAAAQRWQAEVRAAFRRHLGDGLYCAGFEAGRGGGHSRYLFFKDERGELPAGY
ncbi:MAG TPA: GNAT family N-acetyltransferase [Blastocatellia bacterium]|nr:GNAT family N-acetyltransferase [Blastocatellia bacterium]